MSDTKDDSGPASEMTKRELYAGLAMQGLLSAGEGRRMIGKSLEEQSVAQADALIAELKK